MEELENDHAGMIYNDFRYYKYEKGLLRADGLPFLTATHDADNPKSGAVMERIGMTYRYSYEELWQPKNRLVIFRMYQMDLNGTWPTYRAYWDRWPRHWV